MCNLTYIVYIAIRFQPASCETGLRKLLFSLLGKRLQSNQPLPYSAIPSRRRPKSICFTFYSPDLVQKCRVIFPSRTECKQVMVSAAVGKNISPANSFVVQLEILPPDSRSNIQTRVTSFFFKIKPGRGFQ